MRVIAIQPGRARTPRLDERPEPAPEEGDVLVEALAVGSPGPWTSLRSSGEAVWRPPASCQRRRPW